MRKAIALLTIALVGAAGAAPGTAAKKGVPARKSATGAAKKGAATSKGTAARKTTASRKGAQKGRGRAKQTAQTWRSRQLAPTPERYTAIQEALIGKGYLQGTASGRWDQASADALRRFQQDQNLEPNGKLNSLSLIALGLGPKYDSAAAAAAPPPPRPPQGPN